MNQPTEKHDDPEERVQLATNDLLDWWHGIQLSDEVSRLLLSRLVEVRSKLEEIVCTAGEDAGVVFMSQEGPTHVEERDGRKVNVYDLEYFSPLGEALMAAWKLTEVKQP